jgi:hypothetical protein
MCSRFSDSVYNASTLARLLDELDLKAGLPEDGGAESAPQRCVTFLSGEV